MVASVSQRGVTGEGWGNNELFQEEDFESNKIK